MQGVRDTGTSGEEVEVRQPPDLEALRPNLQAVLDAGISSIAVVLKHAAIYPKHEQLVGELAQQMGFKQVTRPRRLGCRVLLPTVLL